MAELRKMIEEMYGRPFILVPIILEIEPEVEVKNIRKVPMRRR